MKSKISFFVIICISILLLIKNRSARELELKYKSLEKERDSLEQVIFVQDIVINQYDISFEILKERDFACWERAYKILSTEVE
jgi:hypothetical protein